MRIARTEPSTQRVLMSKGAIIFIVIALISAILGFGGMVRGDGLGVARLAFFVFALFSFVALVVGRDAHV